MVDALRVVAAVLVAVSCEAVSVTGGLVASHAVYRGRPK